MNEEFNIRKFVAILAASCLLAGVIMGTIIYYVTRTAPPAPAQFAQTTLDNQSTVKDLKIKGNKNSKIYHLPGCASYDEIADKNIVWFKTKEEAEAAGFRMARNC